MASATDPSHARVLEFPMIRSSHAPRSKAHRVLKALPVLAVLVSGCMVQQLSAQGSLTAPLAAQIHSRTAPGLRSSTAPVGSARALRAALPGSTAFGVAPFGLQTQTLDPGESDLAHPNMALATDPLLFGSIGFGDSSAPSTGIGFKQAGTFHFGSQPGGGFDAFSP